MRWPFMRRSTHDEIANNLRAYIQRAEDRHDTYVRTLTSHFQGKVDAEYMRATADGREQVRRWAVEVNYAIFSGNHPWLGTQRPRATAALATATDQFAPARTQLEVANPARTQLEDHKEN